MARRLYVTYAVVLVGLIIVGATVELPIWLLLVVGGAVMLPIAVADLTIARRTRFGRNDDGEKPGN